MLYCTVQDIKDDLTEKVIAQLSNYADPNVVDDALVEKYISDAGDFIDGFLRASYNLPIENEYSILRKVSIDIVKYELYKRRVKIFGSIQNLYKDSISTLEKLQKGMISFN